MKQSLSFLAAGLIAVRAQAPGSLPQCGQTCVNNMLEVAVSDFGCDANDLAGCACCNADFGFGIRDCSREVCGDGSEDYSSVVSYGSSYCASAVTTCPSGTQATTVLASATDGSGSGSGSGTASGSAATPAMTSGPMGGAGGAAGAVSMVSGQSNAYVVNGQTITAGGDSVDEDDTAYSALPSGAGVVISNGDMLTTYMPGSGAGGAGGSGMSSGMMTMSSSGGNAGGAGGALGAAAAEVQTGDGDNNYVVAGDNTISNGGNQYENSGTTYSALPNGSGVLVVADGSSTTVNPASASASTTGGSGGGAGGASETSSGAGGAGGASETSGGSGGAGGSGNDNDNSNDNNNDGGDASEQSGNFAPIQTAAPALIGAAAMAIFAL